MIVFLFSHPLLKWPLPKTPMISILPKSKFHSMALAYFDSQGHLMQLIPTAILKHFLGLVSRTAVHLLGFPPPLLQFIVNFLLCSSSKSWPSDIWIFLDILLCILSSLNKLRHFAMYTLIRAKTVYVWFTEQCPVHSGHSNIVGGMNDY